MCPADCPYCAGVACGACANAGLDLAITVPCGHDTVERHHAMESLAQSRAITKPMPPIPKRESIEITLADRDDLALFLERLATKLRVQGSVRITIE